MAQSQLEKCMFCRVREEEEKGRSFPSLPSVTSLKSQDSSCLIVPDWYEVKGMAFVSLLVSRK